MDPAPRYSARIEKLHVEGKPVDEGLPRYGLERTCHSAIGGNAQLTDL